MRSWCSPSSWSPRPSRSPIPTWAKSRVQATQVRASLEREVAPVYTPKQTRRMQTIRAQEKKRRDKLVFENMRRLLS